MGVLWWLLGESPGSPSSSPGRPQGAGGGGGAGGVSGASPGMPVNLLMYVSESHVCMHLLDTLVLKELFNVYLFFHTISCIC